MSTLQQVLIAVGGGTAAVTWNPSDKSANVALSNGNLTTTGATAGGSHDVVRSTVSKSSGKWYWEIRVDARVLANSGEPTVGVATSGKNLATQVGQDATSWGWLSGSGYYHSNSISSSSPTYGATVVCMIALDMDNGKLYFGSNGTWNNSGNPATSTAPAFTGLSGSLFAALSLGTTSPPDVLTARFKAADQTYSPPSGFSALG